MTCRITAVDLDRRKTTVGPFVVRTECGWTVDLPQGENWWTSSARQAWHAHTCARTARPA